MSQNTGGDEGIVTLCFTTLPHSLTLTGILTSAFRLRFEPLNHGFESHDPQHKNKTPERAFNFCGGDEGIRTLDTLASIPHFQCGALDQLCDVSLGCVLDYSSLSASSGVSSPASSMPSCVSSTKAFSNSASISRNNGSSLATSKDAPSSVAAGVSL